MPLYGQVGLTPLNKLHIVFESKKDYGFLMDYGFLLNTLFKIKCHGIDHGMRRSFPSPL